MIACVIVPFFFTTVERQADPSLTAQPLIIRNAAGGSNKVFAVCAEAAQEGIERGLLIKQAKARVSHAKVIPASPPCYRTALSALMETLADFTDRMEADEDIWRKGKAKRPTLSSLAHQLSPAVLHLDLGSGIPEDMEKTATMLCDAVQTRHQFPIRLGLASNRFAAWVAAFTAEAAPIQLILPDNEARFLAPYSVRFLPLPPEMERRLWLLGILSLGQFAALPAGAVLNQFGYEGQLLHRLVKRIENPPVQRHKPETEYMNTISFDEPLADRLILTTAIKENVASIAQRLLSAGYAGRLVRLTLTLENGGAHEGECILRHRTTDSVHLFNTAEKLLNKVSLRCGVSAVSVTVADVVPVEARQLSLFAESEEKSEPNGDLADLVNRYGRDRFYKPTVNDNEGMLPQNRFGLEVIEVA